MCITKGNAMNIDEANEQMTDIEDVKIVRTIDRSGDRADRYHAEVHTANSNRWEPLENATGWGLVDEIEMFESSDECIAFLISYSILREILELKKLSGEKILIELRGLEKDRVKPLVDYFTNKKNQTTVPGKSNEHPQTSSPSPRR